MADDAPTDDPGRIALSVAGLMRGFGPGELASLRRLDANRPAPAYWRLAARHAALSRSETRWQPIVRAIALLTFKGPPEDRDDLHDSARRLGTAFCDGGDPHWPADTARPMLSEQRLAQLLAARADQRTVLLTRAIRALAACRQKHVGLDVSDLAWAYLSTDPGRIAGPYYQRLDRAERDASLKKDRQDA